ncbi:hypothetical protein C8R45DRAFT_583350 [Mycena sanguinolenta]|nr:hypothetical protein C8R45DRAFT_583350 [Mycena sanguinolenta]
MLGTLAADRARVAELDAEISLLDSEDSIPSLRIERAQVQERLDFYKYPVLTLPNEIVAEIFIHFLPNYPHCPSLTGSYSPSLLTQICRKWRDIALETATLWRAICIGDMSLPRSLSGTIVKIPFEQQAKLFNLWLSRSRICLLSIKLDEFIDGFGITPEHAPKALSIVIPHRARWENLVLHLGAPHYGSIEGPMPLLRRLDLSIVHMDPLEDSFDFDCFELECSESGRKLSISEAPLLRTVLLNGVAALNITLPWAQLTSLTLGGRPAISLRECVPILRETINLLHCQLGLAGGFRNKKLKNLPCIALPRLQSLTLIHDCPDSDDEDDAHLLKRCLDAFAVPALRRLRVPESFLMPKPIDSLTKFLSNTGPQLQELCVTGWRRTAPDSSYREVFANVAFQDCSWLDYREF